MTAPQEDSVTADLATRLHGLEARVTVVELNLERVAEVINALISAVRETSERDDADTEDTETTNNESEASPYL